jgi:hypothetical protein
MPMRTHLVLAIVIGSSLLSEIAAGQPAGHPPRGAPPIDFHALRSHAEKRDALLARYDTNGDRKLDSAEKAAMRDAKARARFEALDRNRDGVLSLSEFRTPRRG